MKNKLDLFFKKYPFAIPLSLMIFCFILFVICSILFYYNYQVEYYEQLSEFGDMDISAHVCNPTAYMRIIVFFIGICYFTFEFLLNLVEFVSKLTKYRLLKKEGLNNG